MTKEQANFLKDVCDDSGNVECEIQEGYSGRGMYGRETFALTMNANPVDLIPELVNWFKNNHGILTDTSEEAGGAMKEDGIVPDFDCNLRIDNMGMGFVIY